MKHAPVFALIAAAFILSGCGDNPFHSGQMVRMKVSGAEGMIVWSQCFLHVPCRYAVRFPAVQLRTAVSLIGPDGPIEFGPVVLIRNIRRYELEAVK